MGQCPAGQGKFIYIRQHIQPFLFGGGGARNVLEQSEKGKQDLKGSEKAG